MGTDQLPDRLLARTSIPADGMEPPGPCLDAETLAAWTDGTLSAPARSAAELHAADCDRCLAMLAAMAKTEPPPIVAAARPWVGWRWIVPLATASIALTTWLVLKDTSTPQRPAPAAPAVAGTGTPSRTDAPVQQEAAKAVAEPGAPAPPPTSAPVEAQQSRRRADDAVSTGALDRLQTRPGELADQRAEARLKAEPKAGATAAAPAARPPVVVPPVAETVEQRAEFRAFAPPVIQSPDPNIRWRLAGSSVERSVDAGRTWQRQTADAAGAISGGTLVAGSSPAATVCWVVGQAGTVLLTTDGENWRRLGFPDPKADLRTVTATDASHATVTTADGRTYVTTDGGARWLLQENAPAPF